MTDEQQTTDTEVDETEETAEDQSAEETAISEEPETKGGNSEAAKWRVKLREAEAERDALKARVGDMQAAEVSRLATGPGALHDGGDLLLTGTLADLLDDEGQVDPDKVSEAVATLTEKKPHLARPAFEDGVGIGHKGNAATTTWADIIGS